MTIKHDDDNSLSSFYIFREDRRGRRRRERELRKGEERGRRRKDVKKVEGK